MSTNETQRLQRFVRQRFQKPALVLQPRDLEIIKLVAQHRVISSDDLQLLVAGSNQVLLRRLQKLFHHGYLDRPRSQRQPGNVGRMVYALGQKGADLLTTETGERPSVDWSEKNRQLGAAYLEHALMASRFQAALRCALQAHGGVVLEHWLADGVIRESVSFEDDRETGRVPVAPDAFFGLRLLNEPEGRNRIYAFLEADRGTMTTKRFLVKMSGYWHYWQSGAAQEKLHIKNFLVVTVARTTERAASLLSATATVDAPLHRGLRMFLFGSEQSYVSGNFARILDPVWTTPGDSSFHSLLE
jgi:hypothetical protein